MSTCQGRAWIRASQDVTGKHFTKVQIGYPFLALPSLAARSTPLACPRPPRNLWSTRPPRNPTAPWIAYRAGTPGLCAALITRQHAAISRPWHTPIARGHPQICRSFRSVVPLVRPAPLLPKARLSTTDPRTNTRFFGDRHFPHNRIYRIHPSDSSPQHVSPKPVSSLADPRRRLPSRTNSRVGVVEWLELDSSGMHHRPNPACAVPNCGGHVWVVVCVWVKESATRATSCDNNPYRRARGEGGHQG